MTDVHTRAALDRIDRRVYTYYIVESAKITELTDLFHAFMFYAPTLKLFCETVIGVQ